MSVLLIVVLALVAWFACLKVSDDRDFFDARAYVVLVVIGLGVAGALIVT